MFMFKDSLLMGISKLFSSYSDENSVDNPIMPMFFNGTTTGYLLPNLYETDYSFTDFQDTILNTDRGVNGYHRMCNFTNSYLIHFPVHNSVTGSKPLFKSISFNSLSCSFLISLLYFSFSLHSF